VYSRDGHDCPGAGQDALRWCCWPATRMIWPSSPKNQVGRRRSESPSSRC